MKRLCIFSIWTYFEKGISWRAEDLNYNQKQLGVTNGMSLAQGRRFRWLNAKTAWSILIVSALIFLTVLAGCASNKSGDHTTLKQTDSHVSWEMLKGETWRGPCKQVEYVLAVPGGHVHGSISAVGEKVDELNWDEAPFEARSHTLRVETRPPKLSND